HGLGVHLTSDSLLRQEIPRRKMVDRQCHRYRYLRFDRRISLREKAACSYGHGCPAYHRRLWNLLGFLLPATYRLRSKYAAVKWLSAATSSPSGTGSARRGLRWQSFPVPGTAGAAAPALSLWFSSGC